MTMQYRTLPRGTEKLSVLGVGMAYVDEASDGEIEETLALAVGRGVNIFDLCGSTSKRLAAYGRALRPVREKVMVQHHFGAVYPKGEYGWSRDLAGGYRYHFPGGQAPTNNYNEIRDRFVRFLTRRNNSTYAEASEAVKKRVAVLMSLATQYTCTVGVNGVPTSMALPGGNPLTYMLLTQGGTGVDFKFSKAPDGTIRLTVNSRYNAQMLVLNNDDGNPAQHRMPAGSTYAFQMTITLPEENLDELANADWAHYDRKAVTDFEGNIDDRINLIPPACRFKGTVDLVFHLHEADAPAPAPAP